MAGNQWVPRSATELTRYALAALPGMTPPPPSQVVPPFFDQITYMSYSQDVSLCTVPAAESAEQVAGFECKLFAIPKYGLPWLSSVKPTNGVDASWPMPASKACCAVWVRPPSSYEDTPRVGKDW